MEALSDLRRAVQHRADENGFEQNYLLLDKKEKKQTSIDTYFT